MDTLDPPVDLLYIEDDESDVQILEAAIEHHRASIKPHAVSATDEAYRLCREMKKHPDVIVVDLNMPRSGAADFLAKIKSSLTDCAHCPIIVVTGLATNEAKDQVRQLGAHDLIQKPFQISAYDALLSAIMDLARLHRLQCVPKPIA